jgi:hypothetical protein
MKRVMGSITVLKDLVFSPIHTETLPEGTFQVIALTPARVQLVSEAVGQLAIAANFNQFDSENMAMIAMNRGLSL